MLQISLLLMKSLNKTETPIFLSVVCSFSKNNLFDIYLSRPMSNVFIMVYGNRQNRMCETNSICDILLTNIMSKEYILFRYKPFLSKV